MDCQKCLDKVQHVVVCPDCSGSGHHTDRHESGQVSVVEGTPCRTCLGQCAIPNFDHHTCRPYFAAAPAPASTTAEEIAKAKVEFEKFFAEKTRELNDLILSATATVAKARG